MISSVRLRRAQERVLLARPYAHILAELVSNAAYAAMSSEVLAEHPLIARREEKRVQLIFMTSDRGLAGSFNSNLIKAAQQFLREREGVAVEMEVIGRKGRDFFRKRDVTLTGEHLGLANKALFEEVAPIADRAIQRFRDREVDAVYVLYNEFKSLLTQKLSVLRVLPMELPESGSPPDYIVEQPAPELVEAIFPRYVRVMIHHALLESSAAEQAARMTAMDAATTNAEELIEKLTLYMNRVRQASITREIIEVVSGATA
jgi:F-type H+-transporting ATPase subunit gamma